MWRKETERKEKSKRENAAGLNVYYSVSPATNHSLAIPIHLPNFDQFNKLWEKLLWHCSRGQSLMIELTACSDPVNVIRAKETIAFKRVHLNAPS